MNFYDFYNKMTYVKIVFLFLLSCRVANNERTNTFINIRLLHNNTWRIIANQFKQLQIIFKLLFFYKCNVCIFIYYIRIVSM